MLLIELINTRIHIPDTCFRFVETAVFSFFHADETVTPSIIFYIIYCIELLYTCHNTPIIYVLTAVYSDPQIKIIYL